VHHSISSNQGVSQAANQGVSHDNQGVPHGASQGVARGGHQGVSHDNQSVVPQDGHTENQSEENSRHRPSDDTSTVTASEQDGVEAGQEQSTEPHPPRGDPADSGHNSVLQGEPQPPARQEEEQSHNHQPRDRHGEHQTHGTLKQEGDQMDMVAEDGGGDIVEDDNDLVDGSDRNVDSTDDEVVEVAPPPRNVEVVDLTD
jgi:hypothetical protein